MCFHSLTLYIQYLKRFLQLLKSCRLTTNNCSRFFNPGSVSLLAPKSRTFQGDLFLPLWLYAFSILLSGWFGFYWSCWKKNVSIKVFNANIPLRFFDNDSTFGQHTLFERVMSGFFGLFGTQFIKTALGFTLRHKIQLFSTRFGNISI